jgi:methylmalonyl-CoA/ethylmalonyl-CoA epimerase
MKLDHVGIIVSDLEESIRYYKELYQFSEITDVIDEPEQNVRIAFIKTGKSGEAMIELIQPVNEQSSVYNFLKKTGGGVHHMSYEVEDLDRSIEHFKTMKALPIGRIYPGAGHQGRRVVWFYTRLKELVELIERVKDV